ncbi:hypothetical protein TBC1_112166 [Lentimicrobium saccharophilum]|uniref:Uncharacterized protein n=1 Tax=Lentimicrobium saccharophilum TaxID=1678841 RepID=A0A0S7BZL5_9BACT|nr:hypothetical protein [Lentimicrobium saccharophilum]GAP44007.1 hypothetical protein TBC1_112166 [Lentimicrobium saccharophilum]
MKDILLITFGILFFSFDSFSQEQNFSNIEYSIIAEGNDSPFENYQIVCFNKYFNLEQLPTEFRDKYDLANPQLFKKKMLVQVFHIDTEKQGLDKFEINEIKESTSEIVFDYSLVNSDTENDSTIQAPFLIVQIPRNTKKRIRFIANGQELGKGKEMYIKN